MSKISVIVPVYNVEKYLSRCVDSILNQSFSDFDLVLVDDGSPDKCGDICDEYAEKDGRIHVIHQENGGLSAARNAGIDWAFATSDSQWLTFIDSDDWIHKDYLSKLYAAAETNGVSIAMCGLRCVNSFVEDISYVDVEKSVLDAEDAFVHHYGKSISACCKLVKKELYRDIRFPLDKLYEDAFVTHKILFACEKIVVVHEELYYYYQNPVSITRSQWSNQKLDSIEAHELRLDYFGKNNYQKAYRWEQKVYIRELTSMMMHLIETSEFPDDHLHALRLMQSKLRLALQKARKEKAITTDRELMWSYLFAMRTDCLWKAAMAARAVYHKMKNREENA